MSDIFISYASEDRSKAVVLAKTLESKGWSVWWDREITVGKSYEQVIEEELDESQCVIVIWSKVSVKSQWVRAEAAEAQRQKKLFPLNIDNSTPPLIYRSLQTADFSSWSGDEAETVFKKLSAAIQGHMGAPVSSMESGSKINKATTPPEEQSEPQLPSELPEPLAIEQPDGENTINVSNRLEKEDIPGYHNIVNSKPEYSGEVTEKSTRSSNHSSLYIPKKDSEASKARKMDIQSGGAGKGRIKTKSFSPDEKTATGVKEQKKPNWVGFFSVVLFLALLIGTLMLSEGANF